MLFVPFLRLAHFLIGARAQLMELHLSEHEVRICHYNVIFTDNKNCQAPLSLITLLGSALLPV